MSRSSGLAILRFILSVALLLVAAKLRGQSPDVNKLPSLAEVVAAGRDVWGELAMQQPNGASYEFFEPLRS